MTTKKIDWTEAKLIIDQAFDARRVDEKCIVIDSCNTVEARCRELEVGHIVWFPKALVLLEPERRGPWEVKRVWDWDRDSRQLRLISCIDKERHRNECIRKDVLFYRIDHRGT